MAFFWHHVRRYRVIPHGDIKEFLVMHELREIFEVHTA